jgi:hypothetical protein
MDTKNSLVEAAKKAAERARATSPREHFERMVRRGLIDRDGQPTYLVPGGSAHLDPTAKR